MSSQPIMVPGGERSHQQMDSQAQTVPVGHNNETFKTMTPPSVSRSLSNREFLPFIISAI